MRDHGAMDKPTVPASFDYSRIPDMPASVFVAPLKRPPGLGDDWLEPAQRKYSVAEHRTWDELSISAAAACRTSAR